MPSSVVPRFQPRQLPENSPQPLLNARVEIPNACKSRVIDRILHRLRRIALA